MFSHFERLLQGHSRTRSTFARFRSQYLQALSPFSTTIGLAN